VRPAILVVDDEPDVASVLQLVCETLNCDVFVAHSIAEARVKMLAGPTPALLLLDVVLPDGDGLDFCREVKATWPSVRVLVLSAYVRPESYAAAQAAGADHFIPKPFDPEALVGTIEHLLRSAA
jgi:two-component system phosphate regulon response regulator OmpR